MDCPACGYALEERRLDQLSHHHCPLCGGVWVPTLRSMQLWAELDAAGELLPALPGEGVPTRADACPGCSRSLEDFAYMGDGDVQLQRCGPCGQLWVPGDQQEGARALWARRMGREAKRLERKAALSEAMRPSVRRALPGNRAPVAGTAAEWSAEDALRRLDDD